ncbi:MAG: hypothetical protein WD041_01660, partial [Nitriliruptoraceae bacterium]
MGRLREWMDTVPPPPGLDDGAVPPAEVVDAIESAEKALAAAAQPAVPAGEAAAADDAGGAAEGDAPAAKATPRKADVHVEGGQMDQATYDQLIAEGKSERMARAKAKAAWVRAEKQRILDEGAGDEGAGGDTPAEDAAADAPTEAGAEPAADGEAEAGPDDSDDAGESAEGDAPAAKAAPRKADVHVEGGQMDQATYDQLIAEGKSERMARAKAKAAWVRAEKQRILDEGGGE